MKPESCAGYSSSQQACYKTGSSFGCNRIRVVRLRRRASVPLGFSVRGGREHGTGIYVSEVRAGSEAHHQGLLVGDQILRINGFNIEHAIHDEVLALLKAKPGVVIKVKSMGIIPVKDTKRDPLTWKIVEPGPSITDNELTMRSSVESEKLESRISIPSIGSSGLGCSIVKGPPDIPGIYVQSVKSRSLAEKAGLQVGDRIMEMNGHNFTNLDFTDAVTVLKSSKQMTLILLKGVGLDLFPEEKLKRSNLSCQTESKKLTSVEEEESRDERISKGMNGSRVNIGSELKRAKDGELKLNGNSSCDSDLSSQQVAKSQDHIAPRNHNNDVQVHAFLHSPYDSEDASTLIRNDARESGDGMDTESLNENRKQPMTTWENDKNDSNPDNINISDDLKAKCLTDRNSDVSPCSSENFRKKLFKKHDIDILSESSSRCYPNSVSSDDKSELSSLNSDDYLGLPKIWTTFSRNDYEVNVEEFSRPQNEFLKRKQHEILMEEFREAHKKMFGQGPLRLGKQSSSSKDEVQDQSSLYKRRQQVRTDRITPPPPPNLTMEKMGKHHLGQVDQSILDTNEKTSFKRRQREPAITDSRDPEPKPPQTYFDKPECGLKPLVTIGTYSNGSQRNRFLKNTTFSSKICLDGEKNQTNHLCAHSKKEFRSSHDEKNSTSSVSITITSNPSSETRSSTSESVLSSDSLFNTSSPLIEGENTIEAREKSKEEGMITVRNSIQDFLSRFSEKDGEVDVRRKIDKALPNRDDKNHFPCSLHQQNYPQRNDLPKEIMGNNNDNKCLITVILEKNGPLNFAVEGGINSDLKGKIFVSEVWAGSCTTEGGNIELGDEILMVDHTRLTGLSLTAANIVLRNAISNDNKKTKFLIAKGMKKTDD